MIKDLNQLPCGVYIGDFRYDEGFRIREEFISPTLTSHTGGGIVHEILLIEVSDEDKASD